VSIRIVPAICTARAGKRTGDDFGVGADHPAIG
jgi:hypothetical protein